MIIGFRKKLKKDGRSLLWFYNKFLYKTDRSYISFAQQSGGFSTLQKDVESAIQKYLGSYER